MKSLVLASTSPRRRELLAQLGLSRADFSFTLVSPDIDETPFNNEVADQYVLRLAQAKAEAGLALLTEADTNNCVVLGSDTIVVLDGKLLGKPADSTEAQRMLSQLSGRSHQVMTAVAVTDGKICYTALSSADVTFCELSDADIAAYIATGEPMDKAGSYGIQGLGGSFVERINGSYSGIVGLPLVETRNLLVQIGVL